ncbi:sulfatase [Clostridium sp. chh4-2]|uniref:sulfatase n=1 Tax=Clostridium sp. chh4-2 TaxID=2067550 RepID=UPI000CCFB63A|nr:sulfatase [Clostridium sp. chh4-2]
MRAIMVMFDSLNRRLLEPYGCDWTQTPNFKRLAEKTAAFDNFYVGSLPCMPARRDIHTGRYSFLHRSWGPLEPFDNSMPRILKENGIYTRLISDHGHYWEDGGCTYHTMYSSWECVRGQEADPWSWRTDEPEIPKHVPTMREFTHPEWWRDNWCNREIIHKKNEWPQNLVFDKGLEFLETNKDQDNWFVQIETFDPHEPFDVPEEFAQLYEDDYSGDHFDWPPYAPVSESREAVEHIRKRYASLLTMCDGNLGRVLDFMDEHDMWKDTMLIVNTDHGFMLGEKDWWAKSVMPCYNELANTPFFMWDPRVKVQGERRKALCQTIDIPASLLEFFRVKRPDEMMGKPLVQVMKEDEPVRDYAIFGFHGSFVNITDGEFLYMRASSSVSNQPLNEYTLMPTHQQGFFSPKELKEVEICGPLPFTRGCKVMKIKNQSRLANATFCNSFQYGNMLFDLKRDPEQLSPVDDPAMEAVMVNALIRKLKESDAPKEQFERLGIDPDVVYDEKRIVEDRQRSVTFDSFEITKKYRWLGEAKNIFIGMLSLLAENQTDEYFSSIEKVMEESGDECVERKHFEQIAKKFYSDQEGKVFYFLNKLARIR